MRSESKNILSKSITYIKGVGPSKAELFQKELGIFTLGDLINHFPFRYEDKTQVKLIKDLNSNDDKIQVNGTILSVEEVKMAYKKKRLSAILRDASGFMELTWFRNINWIKKSLVVGENYLVYGKLNLYKGKKSIIHPEYEKLKDSQISNAMSLEPIYHSTEKLTDRGVTNRVRKKVIQSALSELKATDLRETLPSYLISQLSLITRFKAINQIHLPKTQQEKAEAIKRLKFEEIFSFQLTMLFSREQRKYKYKGQEFAKIGDKFLSFYNEKLPFELTNAQKRVIREIRRDVGSGTQMNRLLQGDVGSGKTMVGLLTMLLALDNQCQSCLMAPTEILAYQHYQSITEYLKGLGIRVAFLSGSIKGKKRNQLLSLLKDGDIDILIGTHALIEDWVQFKNLGLAIIDEQHRFGVKQRSRLWAKNDRFPPHVLVMTATPIPRTLALTLYGDLEVSVIDELPPGRKPVKTVHRMESQRSEVIQFMRSEIKKGRQIYIVFPLIEESSTLDLENLDQGYEKLRALFQPPEFQISVVHGRMKPAEKDMEMERFVSKKTQIMVATTVIEVGVNVPNASVMIIENTERFGLSQLHQLRGRVGRGADQSYCILMSSYKLSKQSKERIKTMVSTTDGFKIAEVDLKLRGPGNLEGTQQSGVKSFKLLNIVHDTQLISATRNIVLQILEKDPLLEHERNAALLKTVSKGSIDWGRIA